MKIGVFICHCGSNIAGTVDCGKVAEIAKTYPDVAFSTDTMYTCSEPGQEEIVAAIKEHKLDGVVVASCTPRMHEPTFRRTVERAGLNKYMFEMANIREHVSWIGKDKEANTNKAAELVRIAVEKLRRDNPLFSKSFESTKRVLVIGGGVAGIQAALDCADAGLDVLLVERESHIGGKMAKLDKTFPTVDCSSCILGPKMVDVAQHPKITLMAASEVTNGFAPAFAESPPDAGTLRLVFRFAPVHGEYAAMDGTPLRMRRTFCPQPSSSNARWHHTGGSRDRNDLHPQPARLRRRRYPAACLPARHRRSRTVCGSRHGGPPPSRRQPGLACGDLPL